MEGADYYMLDSFKKQVVNPRTNLPQLLKYAMFEGVFDLAYDGSARAITATVRVKIVPKDMIELDPATGSAPELMQPKRDANGTPVSVPYDHSKHVSDDAISAANHRKVDRPGLGIDLAILAARVQATLNQDGYKLTVDGCTRGGSCSCLIPIEFKVELQKHDQKYSAKPHHTVDMYPRAVRANASAWGEVNGMLNAATNAWTLNPQDHVITHEVGYPPDLQQLLLAHADKWALKPGARPERKPRTARSRRRSDSEHGDRKAVGANDK